MVRLRGSVLGKPPANSYCLAVYSSFFFGAGAVLLAGYKGAHTFPSQHYIPIVRRGCRSNCFLASKGSVGLALQRLPVMISPQLVSIT